MQDLFGRRIHYKAACSELSGLSIYQPRKNPGQGECPCFLGFWACFLESVFGEDADNVYIWYFVLVLTLLGAVFTEEVRCSTPGR
jgi:hypothetical protein